MSKTTNVTSTDLFVHSRINNNIKNIKTYASVEKL